MKLLSLGRRTATGPDLTDHQQRLTWRITALLLDYPTAQTCAILDELASAAEELIEPIRTEVTDFLRYFRETDATERATRYVETFDMRRRASLHLTYYAYGDTRKRGMALLRFKQTYLASGFELRDDELPDHLCVVLEYAATIDQDRGRELILGHRAGLELLRLALSASDSRWAGAVEAITATLPPLEGDAIDAVRRLAAEGPPEEEVGLDPYAKPSFDPGPATPGSTVALPMPSFPGAR